MSQLKRFTICAILFGLLTVPAKSQDESPPSDMAADARCVVVGLRLAGNGSAAQESAGTMLMLYYIGRLEGRVPELDVEDIVIKEIGRMTSSELTSETRRCGLGLSRKGQQLTKLGSNIAAREGKSPDKPVAPNK